MHTFRNAINGTRVIWRNSIAAHAECDDHTVQFENYSLSRKWHAEEILQQNRLTACVLDKSVEYMPIDRLHVSFGHRLLSRNGSDCLHYCEPDVPDAWFQMLCDRLVAS